MTEYEKSATLELHDVKTSVQDKSCKNKFHECMKPKEQHKKSIRYIYKILLTFITMIIPEKTSRM